MKIKKILISFILTFLVVISSLSFLGSIKKTNASTPSINITIERGKSDQKYETVDGKYIVYPYNVAVTYFRINAEGYSGALGFSLRVYYRTLDYTAIASCGDYTSVDNYVILSSNSSATVTVSNGATKDAAEGSHLLYKFEVYKVEIIGDGDANITISSNNVFGALNTRVAFKVVDSNLYSGQKYFEEYTDYETYYPGTKTNKSNQSTAYNYENWFYSTCYTGKMWDWYSRLVGEEQAHLAIGGTIKFKSNHDLNWFADDNTELTISNDDDKSFYIQSQDKKNTGSGTTFTLGITASNEYPNGGKRILSLGRNKSYYIVDPGYSYSLDFEYHSWDCSKGEWYNGEFEVIIVDLTNPYVTKWSVSNQNPKYADELYISVRFNEPVHVLGNPVLKCAITNSYIYSENEIYDFKYRDGSGTNTLVFSINTKDLVSTRTSGLIVSEIFPLGLEESDGSAPRIYDYGANAIKANNCCADYSYKDNSISAFLSNGAVDPKGLGCQLKVNIDLRQPYLSVSSNFSAKISNENSCTLNVTNASEDSIIYYSFSDSSIKKEIDYTSNLQKIYDSSLINTGGQQVLGNTLKIIGNQMDGERYLHVTVRTPFGITLSDAIVGAGTDASGNIKPIRFDNSVPKIMYTSSIIPDSENPGEYLPSSYLKKYFRIYLDEGPNQCPSGITKVTMIYTNNVNSYVKYKQNGVLDSNFTSNVVYNSENISQKIMETEPVTITSGTVSGPSMDSLNNAISQIKEEIGIDNSSKWTPIIGTLKASESYGRAKYITLEVDAKEGGEGGVCLGLADNSFDSYYIGFIFEDSAGNITQYNDVDIRKYDFDTRPLFESTIIAGEGVNEIYNIKAENLYVVSTSGEGNKIYTLSTDDGHSGALFIKTVKKLVRNPETGIEQYEDVDPVDFAQETTHGDEILDVGIHPGLTGCYVVEFGYDEKISRPYVFYLTVAKNDKTLNEVSIFDKSGEIINTVYSLNSSKYFYKDASEAVVTVDYNGANLLPIFSTSGNAANYVRFMEYQDLSLYYIERQDQADTLENRNVAERFLANGETHKPMVGDYYIRYKKKDWTFGDTEPSSWVYYYYGTDGSSINTGKLSNTLTEAIEAVTMTIVKNGAELFLTDEYLDKYGTPKINPLQYHDKEQIASKTMSNDALIGVLYNGDSGIFQSNVTISKDHYERLLTNYEFSFGERTRIFYRKEGDIAFTELQRFSNNLRTAMELNEKKNTGVFEILELDSLGVSLFKVYNDQSSPKIQASVIVYDDNGREYAKEQEISSALNSQTLNAKSITFNSMTEIDDFGYVAVYKVTGIGVYLDRVYSKKEIESKHPTIESGNYILKVYDRSGNNFSINLITNDSKLNVDVKIVSNTSITFSCNREDSEIQLFEIYRDDVLVTNVYNQKITYKDSGLYRIVVVDWFSNKFEYEVEFERVVDGIEWRYVRGDEDYIFDPTKENEQSGISTKSVSTNEADIYTNGQLYILYPMGTEYSYKFVGYTPDTYTTSLSTGKTMLIIDAEKSYSIIIYYTDFEEIQFKYNVILDTVAPIVNVSTEDITYTHTEIEEMNAYINDKTENPSTIDSSLDGKTFIPSGIGYNKKDGSEIEHYIANGSVLSSKLITISLLDESIVTKCVVKLNGATYLILENSEGINDFTVSRTGVYTIEAYDVLDNKAEFTFENTFSSGSRLVVDGIVYENSEVYGSKYYSFQAKDKGTVVFYVTVNGNSYFYYFEIEEEGVKRTTFKYNSKEVEMETSVPDPENPGQTKKEIVKVLAPIVSDSQYIYSETIKKNYIFNIDEGLIFSFTIQDGYYSFNFESDGEKEYTIQTKYYKDRFEPLFDECKLSSRTSSATIESENKEYVLKNDPKDANDDYVFLNSKFNFVEDSIGEDIVSIVVTDLNEKNEIVIYGPGVEFSDQSFTADGSYVIDITNVYGNVTEVTVVISSSFSITKTAILKGEENDPYNYSAGYDGTIYSNYQVKIYVFSQSPKLVATRNDEPYIPQSLKQGNVTVYVLENEGVYKLNITDEFGNSKEINVEIKYLILSFPIEILTNFPDKANKRDGYTKNPLSINVQEMNINNISYIECTSSDKTTVIYNHFGEGTGRGGSSEMLTEMMEEMGTGEYIISIRDKYGNKASKLIHYKAEPALTLSRTTRADGSFVSFDIEEVKDDFCSNNSLKFETDASDYECTLDGVKVTLPLTLVYGRIKDDCIFKYQDEYGFEYTVKCRLYRAEVFIEAEHIDDFMLINGVQTTNKNFKVLYTEHAKCVYTLDGVEYEYKGETIIRDGVYRFTVTDSAGNMSIVTYKKDSVCEYQFIDSLSGKVLVSGDIANHQNIYFKIKNQDTTYIKDGYLNGEKIENLNEERFTQTGYYEFLIADEVGNESYFEFYVISHAIKGLDYTTPYTYEITSITCETPFGGKNSMMGYVDKGVDNYSSFQFGTQDDSNITSEYDGVYEVTMYSSIYGSYSSFTFTIDNQKPICELVGCAEGEETLNDISIKGYQVGDTIKVYKDGKLSKTVYVDSKTVESPVISSGGEYVITITNEAGLTQTLSFTRTHIANAAGNILIILGAVILNIFLFFGLVYRTRTKIDD